MRSEFTRPYENQRLITHTLRNGMVVTAEAPDKDAEGQRRNGKVSLADRGLTALSFEHHYPEGASCDLAIMLERALYAEPPRDDAPEESGSVVARPRRVKGSMPARSVRVGDETWERAKARAAREGVTVSHALYVLCEGYAHGLLDLPRIEMTYSSKPSVLAEPAAPIDNLAEQTWTDIQTVEEIESYALRCGCIYTDNRMGIHLCPEHAAMNAENSRKGVQQ